MKPMNILRMRKPVVTGGGSDPYWTSVELLIGADVGPTTDQSSRGRTISQRSGTDLVSNSATFAKFGSNSLGWASTGAGLTIPDAAGLDVGSSDYTIEFWARFAGTSTQYLFSKGSNSGSRSLNLAQLSTGNMNHWESTSGSNFSPDYTFANAFNTSAFAHYCVERSGATRRVYRDGVMIGTASAATTCFDTSVALMIGHNEAGAGFSGYMDEFRFTKGVARYASDAGFTPPTARFPRS